MNQKTEIKCSNCVHGITFKKRDDEPSNMGCNESDWAGYTTDEKPSCNGEFFYPKKTMTLKEYQIEAHKTAIYPQDKGEEYLSCGLVSEIGELCGARKKFLRGDFDEREYIKRMMSELGDVMWYVAETATSQGIAFDFDITEENKCERKISALINALYKATCNEIEPEKIINQFIRFSGLTIAEFYTAIEQNIAKLQSRQKNGALRGDGEGVRQ